MRYSAQHAITTSSLVKERKGLLGLQLCSKMSFVYPFFHLYSSKSKPPAGYNWLAVDRDGLTRCIVGTIFTKVWGPLKKRS